MPNLTPSQKRKFEELYIENEMDVIYNWMDERARLALFENVDKENIYETLMKSVESIETIEDVRDGFGREYDSIFEGIHADGVTLCGYDNKVYTFDKRELMEFVSENYHMSLIQFFDFYTYDDTDFISGYLRNYQE